jgi:tRNA(Arg) A34 adenosine deaminase TadA
MLFANPSLREKLINYVTVISTVEMCLMFCVYLQTHSLRAVETSASHPAYAAQVSVRKSYDDKRPDSGRLTARR